MRHEQALGTSSFDFGETDADAREHQDRRAQYDLAVLRNETNAHNERVGWDLIKWLLFGLDGQYV